MVVHNGRTGEGTLATVVALCSPKGGPAAFSTLADGWRPSQSAGGGEEHAWQTDQSASRHP